MDARKPIRGLAMLASLILLGLPSLGQESGSPDPAGAGAAYALDEAGINRVIPIEAFSFWADPSGQAGLDEALADGVFRPAGPGQQSWGYYEGALWLRLRLANPDRLPMAVLVERYGIDLLELHYRDPGGVWQYRRSGWAQPAGSRGQASPFTNLSLPLPPGGGESLVLLRLSSASSLRVEFSIHDDNGFHTANETQLLTGSLLVGLGACFLLTNLIICLLLRRWHYFLFIVYITIITLVTSYNHGIGGMYLWPDWPAFSRLLLTALAAVAALASNLFISSFLELRRLAPRLNRALLAYSVFQGLMILVLVLAPDRLAYMLSALNNLSFPLVQLGLIVAVSLRRIPRSGFFLTAWTLLLIMITLSYLRNFGLLGNEPFLAYGIDIGWLLQMATLSFALIHQVNRTHELEQANAQLERINQALRETLETLETTRSTLNDAEKKLLVAHMVGGVAHELGGPVGNSLLSAGYLEQQVAALRQSLGGTALRPDADEGLERIGKATQLLNTNLKRCSSLLAAFKQLSYDQEPELPETVDLPALLERFGKHQAGPLNQAGVQLVVDCPALKLSTCPRSLMRVLDYLLDNALSHAGMPPGKGRVSIRCSRETVPAERLVLEFADNGQGVPEKLLPRLFEPFFTTDAERGKVGLGLSLVHNLVAWRLGGRIACHNRESGGFAVLVRLPLDQG